MRSRHIIEDEQNQYLDLDYAFEIVRKDATIDANSEIKYQIEHGENNSDSNLDIVVTLSPGSDDGENIIGYCQDRGLGRWNQKENVHELEFKECVDMHNIIEQDFINFAVKKEALEAFVSVLENRFDIIADTLEFEKSIMRESFDETSNDLGKILDDACFVVYNRYREIMKNYDPDTSKFELDFDVETVGDPDNDTLSVIKIIDKEMLELIKERRLSMANNDCVFVQAVIHHALYPKFSTRFPIIYGDILKDLAENFVNALITKNIRADVVEYGKIYNEDIIKDDNYYLMETEETELYNSYWDSLVEMVKQSFENAILDRKFVVDEDMNGNIIGIGDSENTNDYALEVFDNELITFLKTRNIGQPGENTYFISVCRDILDEEYITIYGDAQMFSIKKFIQNADFEIEIRKIDRT